MNFGILIYMFCPTCQEPLHTQDVDNQQVLHCLTCGSTFFDENGINRITVQSAKQLAKAKKQSVGMPATLSCPRDTIFLLPLEEESIPKNVRLFQCPQCKGVFSASDDLVTFKKAQNAKINYFKLWQLPLPALRSVAVFGFLALLSLTLVLTTTSLQQKNLTTSQASDVIRNLSVTSSNRYLFISFKTEVPVRSQILFTYLNTGESLTKDVNKELATLHQYVSGDISADDPSNPVSYQIVLIDSQGKIVVTETQTLQTSK